MCVREGEKGRKKDIETTNCYIVQVGKWYDESMNQILIPSINSFQWEERGTVPW